MKKTNNKNVRQVKSVKKVINSSAGSWSIYVYWFIILFFIAATFYILGRSHDIIHPTHSQPVAEEVLLQANNLAANLQPVTEELLLRADNFISSGREKLVAGNVEEALVDLNTAIETDGNVNAYVLRGEAYMQNGDYKNALSDFSVAIEKDNMNAVAYYDRSILNTRLEDYNAALNDINNALAAQSVKPVDVVSMRDLYAKRGQLNLWMKNWEGAIADYTNSLARPEGTVSPYVYAERAEAYTALGDYENAINDYTSAVRVISEQIQAEPSQEVRENQSSRAMSYFEKSAALNLQINNTEAALSDLKSAYAIATALNDADSVDRLQNLIQGLE